MAEMPPLILRLKGIDDGLSTTADAVADCADQIAIALRGLSERLRQIEARPAQTSVDLNARAR